MMRRDWEMELGWAVHHGGAGEREHEPVGWEWEVASRATAWVRLAAAFLQ